MLANAHGPALRRGVGTSPHRRARTAIDRLEGTLVVRAGGELDLAAAPRWADSVLAVLDPGVRTVVVDLSRVSYFGVSGLSAMLTIDDARRRVGARLQLIAPPAAACRPSNVIGLTNRFAPRSVAGGGIR